MDILFTRSGPNAFIPTRGSEEAAGWDLYAAVEVLLEPYKPTLIPTHLNVAIPDGHFLMITPRSGNALKEHLTVSNAPGILDSDFRGGIMVILAWSPNPLDMGVVHMPVKTYRIPAGKRIAQAVLIPYATQNWIESTGDLPVTQRGSGGFGSTGA